MTTGCTVTENQSTAYGIRRREWIDRNGGIPDGMVIDTRCGRANCYAFEHSYIRPKINLATARPWLQHAFPHILRLSVGETVGVAVPNGIDDEAFRIKLSSALRRAPFFNFRWGVRIREDNIVVVRNLGTWAGHKRSYETETVVQAPAMMQSERRAIDEAAAAKSMTIPKDISVCMGCGNDFQSRGRVCCSVACSRKYRKIVAALARM